MPKPPSSRENILILVKAEPNPSNTYGETVCCAGITAEGEWRRIFPVRFRHLPPEQQFKRWQWVECHTARTPSDTRPESRRMQEDTLVLGDKVSRGKSSALIDRLLRKGPDEAARRNETLCVTRPKAARFYWKRLTPEQVVGAKLAYEKAARQGLLLDKQPASYEPSPFEFRMEWTDEAGRPHDHECGDWETAAGFFRLRREYGEAHALRHLSQQYNEKRQETGLVLALGTKARFPKQWLLLGLLSVPELKQPSFL